MQKLMRLSHKLYAMSSDYNRYVGYSIILQTFLYRHLKLS